MKAPRLSIQGMLILVAMVAVNLAVAPAFSGFPRLGAAVIGIALQFVCFHLIRGRGSAFWMGFVLAGSLSAVSCFLAFPPQEVRLVTTSVPTGGTVTSGVYLYRGSMPWHAWERYERMWMPVGRLVQYYFMSYVQDRDPSWITRFAFVSLEGLIQSLPHWLIALAGGLASHAVIRGFRRVARIRPPDARKLQTSHA